MHGGLDEESVERRNKVQALALRPGTTGEGEAAKAALERLSGRKRQGRAIELSAEFMRRLDGKRPGDLLGQ